MRRCFQERNGARQAYNALPPEARSWLSEDVVYIISAEERCAFLHLETDLERDRFIEQFWYRRSSNPRSPTTDFKDEHYRRIAFANESFSRPLIGWKTDRGRTYILLGPPDSIDSHDAGESRAPLGRDTYEQPTEEWHYLHLEGLGRLDLEFFYAPPYGDYRFALPEDQWHALFASHENAVQERLQELLYPTIPGQMTLYIGVQPVQEVQFKDLEATVVTKIVREQVRFSHRVSFSKATAATTLANIQVDIPSAQLFSDDGQMHFVTTFAMFLRISKPSGWVVDTFETTVDADSGGFGPNLTRSVALPLSPGSYRLALAVKNIQTGDVGVVTSALEVPSSDTL